MVRLVLEATEPLIKRSEELRGLLPEGSIGEKGSTLCQGQVRAYGRVS